MDKINISPNSFIIPMPIALIGTQDEEKQIDVMTAAWINRVNTNPPMIMISTYKSNMTTANIQQTKKFSVNIPSYDLVEKTDYCGIITGKKEDKTALFKIFYGDLQDVPMIMDCPLNFECRLTDQKELPTNIVFFAEIINAYSQKKFLTKDMPDIEKIRPFVLSMPDNRYWYVGKYLSDAWDALNLDMLE